MMYFPSIISKNFSTVHSKQYPVVKLCTCRHPTLDFEKLPFHLSKKFLNSTQIRLLLFPEFKLCISHSLSPRIPQVRCLLYPKLKLCNFRFLYPRVFQLSTQSSITYSNYVLAALLPLTSKSRHYITEVVQLSFFLQYT